MPLPVKKIEGEPHKILSFVKISPLWQALGKAVLKFRIQLIIALVLLAGLAQIWLIRMNS